MLPQLSLAFSSDGGMVSGFDVEYPSCAVLVHLTRSLAFIRELTGSRPQKYW